MILDNPPNEEVARDDGRLILGGGLKCVLGVESVELEGDQGREEACELGVTRPDILGDVEKA